MPQLSSHHDLLKPDTFLYDIDQLQFMLLLL